MVNWCWLAVLFLIFAYVQICAYVNEQRKLDYNIIALVHPIRISHDLSEQFSSILEENIIGDEYEISESLLLLDFLQANAKSMNETTKNTGNESDICPNNEIKNQIDSYLKAKNVRLKNINCKNVREMLKWFALYVTNINRDNVKLICTNSSRSKCGQIVHSHLKTCLADLISPDQLDIANVDKRIASIDEYKIICNILVNEEGKKYDTRLIYLNLLFLLPNNMDMTKLQQLHQYTITMDQPESITILYNIICYIRKNRLNFEIKYDEKGHNECMNLLLGEIIAKSTLLQKSHMKHFKFRGEKLSETITKLIEFIIVKTVGKQDWDMETGEKAFASTFRKYNSEIQEITRAINIYVANNTHNHLNLLETANEDTKEKDFITELTSFLKEQESEEIKCKPENMHEVKDTVPKEKTKKQKANVTNGAKQSNATNEHVDISDNDMDDAKYPEKDDAMVLVRSCVCRYIF